MIGEGQLFSWIAEDRNKEIILVVAENILEVAKVVPTARTIVAHRPSPDREDFVTVRLCESLKKEVR